MSRSAIEEGARTFRNPSKEDERVVVEAVPKELLIGGRWRPATDGRQLPVYDPSTGEVLCQVADAGPADALAALDVAAAAQSGWAKCPPRERSDILRRAFEQLIARADELALLMTLEMGKPLAESKAEIVYAAEFLRWFSEEAVRIDGRYAVAPNGQGRLLVMKQPVGPCLLITPWNFPMAMGTRKIGPAIAAGCTMVVKPARETPLSMLALAKILSDSGLPDGVLNVITTSAAGDVTAPLIADPRLRKMSFTGSTEVGRTLIAQSAHQVLRVSMELGGNAPFIVFDDADLDAAVEGAMIAKMRNIGEACTAANRFLVAESVAADFAERLAVRMGALNVGRGSEPGVQVGPLITAKARDNMRAFVDDARQRGGRVLAGGNAADGPGYYFQPTVIADVDPGSRVFTDEIFGPIAPIASFSSEQEALAIANSTQYGLAAYVYTSEMRRSFRVIEALEFGMVGLNQGIVSNPAAPFGGLKQSGVGREGGSEGIEEYLETKYVAANV
ncbi:succinate-semialdehyde dehydrogenase / glutarate-semialdehyde dehydrogenase [Micromonospora rhizosphaerae]|uniref:Succinate-semialdehyde dehydrogenase / glutarate-semialdehyde dehydrogenase n=1 Tax=Micromonospora rhizosphaerae TaxID=568872 RepID=A0A1C6SXL7_9ACTN|nr:NAD-dependent succinate-semialdehyde dehydrogenase [Micromonospora rhizosphaerae]SCL34301.1 succinate-semialdehyde dehydrogenase / glutarate-semialdehyde dehydrogenase [Micromonospora rhizosphaerae]